MLKARHLRAGDTVAAVSLSWGGPGAIPHRYEAGKRQLIETFGVEVIETPHALRDPDWLHRNPQARADDLMEAFANPTIRGIISTIGGDESIRLLPFLDSEIIRANPKVFLGYSDTTVAHLACFSAGLCTFYGPAIMSGFAENGGMFSYMVDAVRRTMFSAEPPGLIAPNRDGWTVERLEWADPANQARKRRLHAPTPWSFISGHAAATGRLIGGCLEVLSWLRGTSAWPEQDAFDRAILFIETSEERIPPHAVARELRTLAAMGILQRLSGLIVGRPGGDVPVEQFSEYDQAVLQIVHDEADLSDLAVVTRMDFGHTDPMFVLPYGVTARIDPVAQTFEILEAAVID
ncbi:MAG TPA: S66 peptidase family protein [Gemmatimonadaceae bacterium]|jgi:muramoyltetrapeptide carboxypeptidase LdcA involved in peptidoglycan recycling|nr:S66 peptidase family protein [Gemmatimonadaceae bacterium]